MKKLQVNPEYCAKALENVSGVAKTYLRVSKIKTALTVFLVGYAAIKITSIFIQK